MDERERYFINGNWVIDWPGRYESAGVAFHYERTRDAEVVRATGPLQHDLVVMVYSPFTLSACVPSRLINGPCARRCVTRAEHGALCRPGGPLFVRANCPRKKSFDAQLTISLF